LLWLRFAATSPTPILSVSNTTQLYRRAIFKAMEELQDWNSRSPISSIRKHVESQFQDGDCWNEAIFCKTLKSLLASGDLIEDVPQPRHTMCSFSPEWKKKRADVLASIVFNHERE
jgi:hypothetical protein